MDEPALIVLLAGLLYALWLAAGLASRNPALYYAARSRIDCGHRAQRARPSCVSYTQGRRFISSLEQHVHGYMEVLPVVAVGLLAVLNWEEVTAAQWILRWKSPPLASATHVALLGSFFVLTGAPIVEELIRTSRRESRR